MGLEADLPDLVDGPELGRGTGQRAGDIIPYAALLRNRIDQSSIKGTEDEGRWDQYVMARCCPPRHVLWDLAPASC